MTVCMCAGGLVWAHGRAQLRPEEAALEKQNAAVTAMVRKAGGEVG
jgi:hypothetical protein